MAIRKLKAASTHFDNLGESELGKGDQEMVNNQKVGVLIAPTKAPGFFTHSVEASAKKRKQMAISIGDLRDTYEPDDLDNYDPVENEDDLELDNSGAAAGDLELPDGDEFIAELDDEDDLENDDFEDDDVADDLEEPTYEEDVGANDDLADDETEADVMDIVDVDDMPEEVEEDDISVAALQASLLVLKGDRVIASMNKQQATEEGVEDEFLSDEFADVVASVCATKGLRRGLSEMGFKMAKVNLGASRVVARQVAARTKQATAKVQASVKKQAKSMTECLALAAVGINKGFWKDVPNPLKASVEASLLHAGVQNPKAVASRLFAAGGVEYAKAMVTVAQRLSVMPEATRNTLAEALDFTNDQIEDDDEDIEGEAIDVDDDDADFQDIEASTIEAALARPGRKQVAALLTPKTPITARTVLESSDILEF